jgi:hypothetical protein
MPIESEAEVTSSGSSSTVNVTVQETSGTPGGPKRYVDVFMHIEPDRHSGPLIVPSGAFMYRRSGIDVWWKDVELATGSTVSKSIKVVGKKGRRYRGCSNYWVLVKSDSPKTLQVHQGCLYNDGAGRLLLGSSEHFMLVARKRPRQRKARSARR